MGNYILCLNSDTKVHQNSFSKFADYLLQNNNIGAIGIRLVDEKDVHQNFGMRFLSPIHFFFLSILPKSLVQNLPLFGGLRYGKKIFVLAIIVMQLLVALCFYLDISLKKLMYRNLNFYYPLYIKNKISLREKMNVYYWIY